MCLDASWAHRRTSNLVDFYAEGGITFTGMVPHRGDDALGIGFAYTGVSNRVRGFDSDLGLSVRQNYEAVLEDLLHGSTQAGLDAAT